jgi:hypothetical protein
VQHSDPVSVTTWHGKRYVTMNWRCSILTLFQSPNDMVRDMSPWNPYVSNKTKPVTGEMKNGNLPVCWIATGTQALSIWPVPVVAIFVGRKMHDEMIHVIVLKAAEWHSTKFYNHFLRKIGNKIEQSSSSSYWTITKLAYWACILQLSSKNWCWTIISYNSIYKGIFCEILYCNGRSPDYTEPWLNCIF